MCPENSHVEALAPSVMVFADGTLWEVIRIRLGYEDVAFLMGLMASQEEKKMPPSFPLSLLFSLCLLPTPPYIPYVYKGQAIGSHSKRVAICKPEREASLTRN